MGAINRFLQSVKYTNKAEFNSLGVNCIFVSHQKDDVVPARNIANALQEAGVEVYFDEYDEVLKEHHGRENAKAVTQSICNGINNSSHMLVVVSQHTLESTWVPFEIGYGFEKTELYILCLKDISRAALPEYMRTAKILRDIYGLKKLVKQLGGDDKAFDKDTLESILEECIEEEQEKK